MKVFSVINTIKSFLKQGMKEMFLITLLWYQTYGKELFW